MLERKEEANRRGKKVVERNQQQVAGVTKGEKMVSWESRRTVRKEEVILVTHWGKRV